MTRRGAMDFSISEFSILSVICRCHIAQDITQIFEGVHGCIQEDSLRTFLTKLCTRGLIKQSKVNRVSAAGKNIKRVGFKATNKGEKEFKAMNIKWGAYFDHTA